MSGPLNIAFMTTLGRNVGDEFIREGIRSFFDDLGIDYEPLYVDKHDLRSLNELRGDEVRLLHDKFCDADVIVQAGAPVYWCNGPHRSYTAAWADPLWFDRIFRLTPKKPFFNIGAGAGQKSVDDLQPMIDDQRLIDFAQRAGRASRFTTVRDPLAHRFLEAAGVAHELLPCPALHAARRINGGVSPVARDVLAVNLMPLAGHYRLKPETDAAQWRATIDQLLPKLRKQHALLFVAHDAREADFMTELARGQEAVFLSPDYRDYLSLYSRVKGIVANRVHAAVAVAGFGRPAVIVGNDARIGIAQPMDIPAIDSSQATAKWILAQLEQQMARADRLFAQRMELREQSARRYISALAAELKVAPRTAAA